MPTKPIPCPDWNPYHTYVWSTKQVQAWLERNGNINFYDGAVWDMVKKNLGVGRYSIRFIARKN